MSDRDLIDHLIRELKIVRDTVAANGRKPDGPTIEIGYPTAMALLRCLEPSEPIREIQRTST